MSRIGVGPLVLLIPDAVVRWVTTKDMAGHEVEAFEVPAVVAGPGSTLLEVAYRRWDQEGQITTVSRGDSHAAFDRLTHGARLGVRDRDDGTDACDVGLLRWDPDTGTKGWGNPSKATVDELDATLADSSAALLLEAGSHAFGDRASTLGDNSPRRNWLTATFPSGDPLGPLTVYAMTRVLPIVRAMGGTS